jgi:hypothetical protein
MRPLTVQGALGSDAAIALSLEAPIAYAPGGGGGSQAYS